MPVRYIIDILLTDSRVIQEVANWNQHAIDEYRMVGRQQQITMRTANPESVRRDSHWLHVARTPVAAASHAAMANPDDRRRPAFG